MGLEEVWGALMCLQTRPGASPPVPAERVTKGSQMSPQTENCSPFSSRGKQEIRFQVLSQPCLSPTSPGTSQA